MARIAISRGHGGRNTFDVGAKDLLTEVIENRRVGQRVTAILNAAKVETLYFEETAATTVNDNLFNLVAWHNRQVRDIDIQMHFNKVGSTTDRAIGVEVWHYGASTRANAARISQAISKASGLKDRGAKQSTELYFLRASHKPAYLIEVCFVESRPDVALYQQHFEAICQAIAKEAAAIIGVQLVSPVKKTEELDDMKQLLGKTQQDDMRNLLQRAYDTKVFAVNHALKVDKMTRGEALDLLISYNARTNK